MSLSREEIILQEIQSYLSSFKVARDCTGMTAAERMEALESGIRSYFDEYPREWEPLAEYIESGWDQDGEGIELERLLVPELVLRTHQYLREEMGYEWLTKERVFAYDYSF